MTVNTVNQSKVNANSWNNVRNLPQDEIKDDDEDEIKNDDKDEIKDNDKDEIKDEADDEIKDMVEKPGKDPPSRAGLYAVVTNVDTDENEIKDMVTDVGTDKDQIVDVVEANANNRDCAGPHLAPETLLKRSGREETEGDPLQGRSLRDRG